MAPLKGEYGEYDVAGAQQLLEESVGVMMGDDGFYLHLPRWLGIDADY